MATTAGTTGEDTAVETIDIRVTAEEEIVTAAIARLILAVHRGNLAAEAVAVAAAAVITIAVTTTAEIAGATAPEEIVVTEGMIEVEATTEEMIAGMTGATTGEMTIAKVSTFF